MSSGPIGTKRFEPKTYYHLKLTKKDWCNYLKQCPIEDNVGENYCWTCKHCKKIDVATLLIERGRD